MKVSLILVTFVGMAFAASNLQWQLFKTTFNKKYATLEEEATRRAIFSEHLTKNAEHNVLFDLGLKSFRRGVNEFSDQVSW